LPRSNWEVSTPRLHDLPGKSSSPFQLPGFDASILKSFCFLFYEFCLLFSRRQNPAVGDRRLAAEMEASKPGSSNHHGVCGRKRNAPKLEKNRALNLYGRAPKETYPAGRAIRLVCQNQFMVP
jgi:hypothetical protein